jgi:FMN-dependent NADH-azoreductase
VTHLLHLDSSARRTSFSRELSARYAAAWDGTRTYRDLAADPVPVIGEAWTEICDALLTASITDPARYADVVLIGAPMYNVSIPAALKTWIDQVTFPRMSLRGKAFVIAGARGGTYAPGTPRAPFDHHEAYLPDVIAGHYDVGDVRFVHAELTNALADPHLAARDGERAASLEAALREL